MSKNRPFIFLLAVLVILVSVGSFVFYYFLFVDGYPVESRVIEIKRGSSLRAVADLLDENDLVRDGRLFLACAFLTGSEGKIQAGEYEIKSNETLGQMVNRFVRGDVLLRKVTIPEGKNILEIAGLFDEKGIADKNSFIETAMDEEFTSGLLGKDIKSPEGYLFPETYHFPKDTDPKDIIRVMTDRFKSVYSEISKNEKNSLSNHEIVILASMIEKETGEDSERADISAVFHNRLRKGMRLECDPTVIYGMGEQFDGNLTKKDLLTPTPYNTYQLYGLPRGPIANPGKESLDAAINPSGAKYLYFVSKGDGTHYFSNNYRSHVNAVNKYIKNKRN